MKPAMGFRLMDDKAVATLLDAIDHSSEAGREIRLD